MIYLNFNSLNFTATAVGLIITNNKCLLTHKVVQLHTLKAHTDISAAAILTSSDIYFKLTSSRLLILRKHTFNRASLTLIKFESYWGAVTSTVRPCSPPAGFLLTCNVGGGGFKKLRGTGTRPLS
jgi:hypothetical protein